MPTFTKMPSNFIRSLRFSRKGNTPAGVHQIHFSLPKEGENTITVICGRNRTGKSYLLKVIKRCFETYNKKVDLDAKDLSVHIPDNDMQIEVTESNERINYFLVSNINDLIRYINSISIEKDTKFKERGSQTFRIHFDDPVRLKIALDLFAEDILNYLNPNSFDKVKWNESDSYRHEIVSSTFQKNTCYKLNSKDDLVSSFLKGTGGHLYIGWNSTLPKTNLGIYLYYDDDRIIYFENWSDGQKVLFLCLIISKYIQPEILVFDEIENHLHPEYISVILEHFKKTVRQTILSSHHPHIIFSNYVNAVWYLEIINEKVEYPEKISKEIKGPSSNLAPVRRCFELKKNYNKVAKVYDLFDSVDNNLIRLSQSTLSDFNDLITDIFTNIYHYDIAVSVPSKKSDIQVDGLLKHVIDKIDRKGKINVLEIGSGKGRIMLDIAKIGSSKISDNVSWTLYEPIIPVFDTLKENITELQTATQLNYNIEIVNSLSIQKEFDIIFFANVVHELTPNIIANYFYRMPSLIKNDGEVLIIEIFPLLYPEYFSVPYKNFEIDKLFRKLNWTVSSDKLNIKNAKVEAYCSVLRKKANTCADEKQIVRTIEKFWKEEIIPNRCADYGGRSEFKSADETILLMCELTTIASINSYFSKEWDLQVL